MSSHHAVRSGSSSHLIWRWRRLASLLRAARRLTEVFFTSSADCLESKKGEVKTRPMEPMKRQKQSEPRENEQSRMLSALVIPQVPGPSLKRKKKKVALLHKRKSKLATVGLDSLIRRSAGHTMPMSPPLFQLTSVAE